MDHPAFPTMALAGLLLALAGGIASCTYDFEAFDPRLGAGTDTGVPGTCTPQATEPCYSGDPATENVGICHGGERTCNGAGTAWGACVGEVTPRAEDCNTPDDDDCDGLTDDPDVACECVPGNELSCYDGPDGTVEVGKCHAGLQVCLPTGTEYGECFAQMVPSHEECATPDDDDCDGTANDHCGTWSHRFDATYDQWAWTLAADGSDNVIIGGEIEYRVDFGGGNVGVGTDADAFAAKFDSAGAHQWSRAWGDSGYQAVNAVAADGSGNVYLTGVFASAIDFGSGYALTATDGVDGFVAKLDAAGNTLWATSFGAVGDQGGDAIAVQPSGALIVIGGGFESDMTLGTDLLTNAGGFDGFWAALDSDGNVVIARQLGGTGDDGVAAVAVDGSGGIYVAGLFTASIDFGAGPLASAGGVDAFVAKLDSGGVHQWSHGIGPAGEQRASELALGPSGQVIVGGDYAGSIDTPANSYDSAGSEDMWLLVLDGAGAEVWSRSLGGVGDDDLNAVAVNGAGSLLIGGAIDGTVDLGDGPLLIAGSDDWFLAGLDSAGTVEFSRRFGDNQDDDIRGLAPQSTGGWFVVGETSGDIDVGTGLLPYFHGEDIVLWELAP